MISKTASAPHNATVFSAESTRQSAVRGAGVTPAQARTAEIAYYQAVYASAVSNGVDAGPFIHAVQNLGATV
jgi:hypothetical protein